MLISPADLFETERTLPHGHVEAILGTIRKIGLDTVISSKRCPERDLVLAMIVERLIHPCSKLATTRLWHTTTLAEELSVQEADENDLYEAMDWLLTRQERIEKKLAERHLTDGAMVLYDVSSSYYKGRKCPLAKLGHDRDGQKGLPIIVYGVLTDNEGRPVAVSVYRNTGDPTTVPDQVDKVRQKFELSHLILVGDRGVLTQPQINTLKAPKTGCRPTSSCACWPIMLSGTCARPWRRSFLRTTNSRANGSGEIRYCRQNRARRRRERRRHT